MASAAGTDGSSGGGTESNGGSGNLFQLTEPQHQPEEQLNSGLSNSNSNWSRTYNTTQSNMEFAPGQDQGPTGMGPSGPGLEMVANADGGSGSGFHGQGGHAAWNHNHINAHTPLQSSPYISAAGGPNFMQSSYGHGLDHGGNGAGAGGMTPDHSAYYEYAPPPPLPTTALPMPMPSPYGYSSVTSAAPSGLPHGHSPAYLPAHGHQLQHEYEYPFYTRPPPHMSVAPHLHPAHPAGQQSTAHQHQHLMPFTYNPGPVGVGPVNSAVPVHAPSPAHVYRRQSHELTPFLDNTGWNPSSWNQGDGRETSITALDLRLHREGLALGHALEDWPLALVPPRQDRQTQTGSPSGTTPQPSPRAKLELAPAAHKFEYQDPALLVHQQSKGTPAPPPELPASSQAQSQSATAATAFEPTNANTSVTMPQASLPVLVTAVPSAWIPRTPGVIVSRPSGEPLREGVKRRKSATAAEGAALAVNGVIFQAGPATEATAHASGARSASVPGPASIPEPESEHVPGPAPHGGDPFAWNCQVCGKSCTSRNGLQRHIRHAHSAKKTTTTTSPPLTPTMPEAEAAAAAAGKGEIKTESDVKALQEPEPRATAPSLTEKIEPDGASGKNLATSIMSENGPNVDEVKELGSEAEPTAGSNYSRLTNSRHQPRIVLQKVIVSPSKTSPSAPTSNPAESPDELELDKRSRAARHKKRSRSLTPSNVSSALSFLQSTPTKMKSPKGTGTMTGTPVAAEVGEKQKMVNGAANSNSGPARRSSLSKVPQTCGLCGASASTMSNLRRHYRQRHPKCKLPSTAAIDGGTGAGAGTFLKPGPLLPTQPDSDESPSWCSICEQDVPDLRLHKLQEHQLQLQIPAPGFSRMGEEHARAAVGAVAFTLPTNGNSNGAQEDSLGEMPVLDACQPFVQLEEDTESELCKGPVEGIEVYPPLLKREVIESPSPAISPSSSRSSSSLRVREVRVLVRDVGSNLTPCPICTVEYPLSAVNAHKYTHELQCHICLRDDVPVAEMAEHGVTHVATLECEVCGYLASRKQRMWEHFNRHAKVKPVICMVCGEGFYSKDNMRGHHKAKHEGRRDLYPCRRCGMRFSLRSQRYRHEMSGHKKGKGKVAKGTVQVQRGAAAAMNHTGKPTIAKSASASPTKTKRSGSAPAPKLDDVNNNSNKRTAAGGSRSSSAPSTATASSAVPNDKTCQLCHKELSSNRSMLRHLLLIHGVTLAQKPKPQLQTATAAEDADSDADADHEEGQPPAVNAVAAVKKMSNSRSHRSRPKVQAFAYARRRSVSHSPTNCNICGRVLSSASAVRRHQALVHNKAIGKYPEYFASQRKACDICAQVLSSARSLQRHLVLIHNKRVGNYTKILMDNRKSWHRHKKRAAAAKRKRPTSTKAKAAPRPVEPQED